MEVTLPEALEGREERPNTTGAEEGAPGGGHDRDAYLEKAWKDEVPEEHP